MGKKIAVIGIIITNRKDSVQLVNKILSDYAGIILGRMGIPYKEKNISVISIIVDGTTDEIGAVTGKLGNIKGVKVKVAFAY